MARFGSIYSIISDAGKDWLDEHADELDDSLVTFARKLARTPSTTRGMQVSDIGAIGALVCTPDFCGLTAEDVYNIIAHEEHVLEWSFLDLHNKEMSQVEPPQGTRALLYMLMENVDHTGVCSSSLTELFENDSSVDFITCSNHFSNGVITPCVDNAWVSKKLDTLLSTDYWVCVDVSDKKLELPEGWEPGSIPGTMSAYWPYGGISEEGEVFLGRVQSPCMINEAYRKIIFVPARKIASRLTPKCSLNTFLPEMILDKYNLPKATY